MIVCCHLLRGRPAGTRGGGGGLMASHYYLLFLSFGLSVNCYRLLLSIFKNYENLVLKYVSKLAHFFGISRINGHDYPKFFLKVVSESIWWPHSSARKNAFFLFRSCPSNLRDLILGSFWSRPSPSSFVPSPGFSWRWSG